ncbi:hypothetical protein AG1IA_05935 [Rhizoctonia solani AG-1 IA]|uniref:Uncharacterized protein n=1 Tax=Thanatephorus cucumeris (strain AG1-IA) TaxID=983506 RepID=L8WTD9_THACA|nr:hypothetical protein AG1IA_05935 [Rhizoctonia solani AG-1 IA]
MRAPFTPASRSPVWLLMPAWVILVGLLNCWQVSAAAIGTTSLPHQLHLVEREHRPLLFVGSINRIPVPGFPDIVVTTFSLPNKSKTGSSSGKTTGPISIIDSPCTNMCSGAAGTGPNQFDCTTIANSLYAISNQTINLSPFLGTEWSFRSCKIIVTNQSPTDSVM